MATTNAPAPHTACYTTVSTPNGPFTAIVGAGESDTHDTVIASGWTDDPNYLAALIHRTLRPTELSRSDRLTHVSDAVSAYYAGEFDALRGIEVTQLAGGTFLGQAWKVLREVAPGEPVTYTRFAELSGSPAAVRAAASACARNAAALFVPCHRVLRSDGSLGGFRYGLDIKRWLLDHEAPAA